MANIDAQANWSPVRILEQLELARGGINGNMNEQAKSLVERTEFLKENSATKADLLAISGGLYAFSTLEIALTNVDKLPEHSKIEITNDAQNNGVYLWEGGKLTPSDYNPSEQTLIEAKKFALENINETERKAAERYVLSYKKTNDDLLIALTDFLGNRTWLEASSKDGGLTSLAKKHLFNSMNALFKSISNDEYFFSLTDTNGFATDLTLNNNGQLHDFIVKRLAKRLPNFLREVNRVDFKTIQNNDFFLSLTDSLGVATDVTLNSSGQFAEFVVERLAERIKSYLHESNEIQKPLTTLIYPKVFKFSVWGSSTIERTHQMWLDTVVTPLGFTDAYLGGRGGERAQQTTARFGSNPVKVTISGGVIPESGAVRITPDWEGTNPEGMQSFEGTLNGVHGTLRRIDQTYLHEFERTNAGTAVASPDVYEFIPDLRTYNDGVLVLNLGKNNYLTDASDAITQRVFDLTVEAYNYAKPYFKYVVILGHTTNTDTTLEKTTQILKLNSMLEDYFSDRYVDIHRYIMSEQVWIDLNITPTSTDLEQQVNNIKPSSLSADVWHLADPVAQKMVDFVKAKLIELNWKP